jgi:hypothetical protein
MRRLLVLVVLLVGAVGSVVAFWWLRAPDPGEQSSDPVPAPVVSEDAGKVGPAIPADQVIERASAFYASRPTFQRPKPHTPVPEGLASMTAESCGGCHRSIYEEWQISTHARAWLDDAQFQEELSKSRSEPPHEDNGDVGWMCVNCHTPLMNQLPQLVVGLEDDDISKPIYAENPHFDAELQNDAITCATCHVRDGKVLGPYGSKNAPHPVEKAPELLTEQVCVQCHQAEALFPEQNLGCFFTTGAEWKSSEYGKRGETCQTCHMPEIERHVADNFTKLPKRKTRRHWFGGSLIPKKPEFAAELEPLEAVYGDGVELLARLEGPCVEQPQPCTRIAVDIANANAGHHVPSGDPERHLIIAATAVRDGEKLGEKEQWIGSRYTWWPEIKLEESNRIPAGETFTFYLDVPAALPFDVEVVGNKYRMYEEAFEHHHLEGRYVRGREFERRTFEFTSN